MNVCNIQEKTLTTHSLLLLTFLLCLIVEVSFTGKDIVYLVPILKYRDPVQIITLQASSIQSESRLDNGVISINLSRTFFNGIGHVLEYIDQVLKIHSF